MKTKTSDDGDIRMDIINGEDEISTPAGSVTDVQEKGQPLEGLEGPSLMTRNSVDRQPGSQGLGSLQNDGRSNEATDWSVHSRESGSPPLVSKGSGGHPSNLPVQEFFRNIHKLQKVFL